MIRQYLITDGTCQLGNVIVRMLLDNRQKVRVLVNPEDSMEALEGLPIEICYGSVLVKDSMKEFYALPDPRSAILIHTAEKVSISVQRDPSIHRINVQGTINVTDMCVKMKIGRLIYIGAASAIPYASNGKPVQEIEYFNRDKVEGDFAKSKAEASQYILDKVKLNGLYAVIVHPSGIIGPFDYRMSDIAVLIQEYLDGKLIAGVEGGYDFADVRDVAKAVIAASERGEKGANYLLSNQYVSVKEFLDDLNVITGEKRVKKVLPLWFIRRAAPLTSVYCKIRKLPSPYSQYSLFTVHSKSKYDHSRAEAELEYCPRDVNDSLADTVLWIENRSHLAEKATEKQ